MLDPTRRSSPRLRVHHAAGRCSITGDCLRRGAVWSIKLVGGAVAVPGSVPHLSSFGEDANGELYLVSLDGSVHRLTE